MKETGVKDGSWQAVLKLVAPGTPLRSGLENILRARTGALIVIGDTNEVIDLLDGGFFINKECTPSNIYELAKMDGAIVLSKDAKKILYANALLIPDSKIPTNETGTRHKTAERVSKQTGEIVISISQRRNIITLYKGINKYILKDTASILNKANQAVQTLEKYKNVLDSAVITLNLLEFEDSVTLDDVVYVIQRTEMVMRISSEIERYICELGNEGRLVSMQLKELVSTTERDERMLVEDYMADDMIMSVKSVLNKIKKLSDEELINSQLIGNLLGYMAVNNMDLNVSPKGYRIMSKIPRVPIAIVNNLINEFNDLQGILRASIKELDDVDGIGEVRAKTIKEGLKRAQEQLVLDNKNYLR